MQYGCWLQIEMYFLADLLAHGQDETAADIRAPLFLFGEVIFLFSDHGLSNRGIGAAGGILTVGISVDGLASSIFPISVPVTDSLLFMEVVAS